MPGTVEPQPCGTRAAYQRHLAHGEVPCDRCTTANTEESRTRRGYRPRTVPKCGTRRAYQRHQRRRETADAACLAAEAAYGRERAEARRRVAA